MALVRFTIFNVATQQQQTIGTNEMDFVPRMNENIVWHNPPMPDGSPAKEPLVLFIVVSVAHHAGLLDSSLPVDILLMTPQDQMRQQMQAYNSGNTKSEEDESEEFPENLLTLVPGD